MWSSTPWRQSWRDPWSFVSPRALRLAFSLPAPIAVHQVVEQAIFRHLPPMVYHLPANGYDLLALRRPGALRHAARKVARKAYRIGERLAPGAAQTPDDQRARILTENHVQLLDDLVAAPNGIAAELLGAQGARTLVQRNVAQRRLWPLGSLITMETFRRSIQRVRHRAREAELASGNPERE